MSAPEFFTLRWYGDLHDARKWVRARGGSMVVGQEPNGPAEGLLDGGDGPVVVSATSTICCDAGRFSIVPIPVRCPTCESPRPSQHPAMQSEGEVQPCGDPWHGPPDSDNRLGVQARERWMDRHATGVAEAHHCESDHDLYVPAEVFMVITDSDSAANGAFLCGRCVMYAVMDWLRDPGDIAGYDIQRLVAPA